MASSDPSAFVRGTDSLQGIRDRGDSGWTTATGFSTHSAADAADAVWNETATGHTDAGKAGQQLWTDIDAILVDTSTGVVVSELTQAALADMFNTDSGTDYDNSVAGSVVKEIADNTSISAAGVDSIWDEGQSGHATAGTFGKYLDAAISGVGGAVGSGAIAHTVTVTDGDSNPLDGCEVWITTDQAGSNVTAGVVNTDANGEAAFMLDAGTYYVWKQLSGYNFTNPETITVS